MAVYKEGTLYLTQDDNQHKTLSKFFNSQNIDEIKNFHSSVDVICSANVIAHIPDLKDVIKSVDRLLSYKGLLIFEEH